MKNYHKIEDVVRTYNAHDDVSQLYIIHIRTEYEYCLSQTSLRPMHVMYTGCTYVLLYYEPERVRIYIAYSGSARVMVKYV